MTESTIAIVGSGIVGTAMARTLAGAGHDVVFFEKGPAYAYPHSSQFRRTVLYGQDPDVLTLPRDLQFAPLSGDYRFGVNEERTMKVGGTSTLWEAITLRMRPSDFTTKSLFGFGEDWPISYEELEPYYCQAESLLGVSGTDADNPFAPPRSRDYPLPPFDLSFDDKMLAARLEKSGITLHTTPQARTRLTYEQRPGCMNYGTCEVCPIGARYSPNYHLEQLVRGGLCKIHPNVSVRRILLNAKNQADRIVYRANDSATDKEHRAKVIIVAAGTFESARLLFLSTSRAHPHGLGNETARLGKGLTMHHIWTGWMRYREKLYPGRFAGWTGQSYQFLDPENRGEHGGIKVEFATNRTVSGVKRPSTTSVKKIEKGLQKMLHWRRIGLHAESDPSEDKYVTMSAKRDRFGDQFVHVHYQSTAFDRATYGYAKKVHDTFVRGSGADRATLAKRGGYRSGCHHMGGCRMAREPHDGVVDPLGRVHGCDNLYVAGGGVFPGTSGAINPTLTMVALAMRSAEHIAQSVL